MALFEVPIGREKTSNQYISPTFATGLFGHPYEMTLTINRLNGLIKMN